MKQRLIDANDLSKLVGEPFEKFLSRLDLICPEPVDAIPKELYEQTQWERDVALSQLKQLNIGLGEKPYLKAIPINWIIDWLTRQHIPATHTCDDYYAVEMMLDDWEKENEV